MFVVSFFEDFFFLVIFLITLHLIKQLLFPSSGIRIYILMFAKLSGPNLNEERSLKQSAQ